jgi:uncharacterized protein DUF1501
MFTLGNQQSRTCGGIDRRGFLRIGGLTTFGLSLPKLLAAESAQPSLARKDVNCILLWMGGGPSNVDTFDMKPDAPAEYRGDFKTIPSNLSGLSICEYLPQMAKVMDKVSLLRSVTHTESGDHVAAVHYMMTGYPQRPDPTGQPANSLIYPSYGSVVSREQGWQNGLPPYVVLTGKAAPYMGAGYIGSGFNPLTIKDDPNEQKFAVRDVSIPDVVGTERTSRRRAMLSELDQWQRLTDRKLGALVDRDRFYQQAYDLITSSAAKRAFQVDEEPAAVRDRYGRHRFGQAALVARRLIEAGVRFVSVETHWWDTHQNNFKDLKDSRLPNLDQFWSALLEDLDQRGLLATTLVIWMGEFGRTPKVNGQAGRDHWAPTNAICLSGAGIKHGTIVGQTDAHCAYPLGTSHSTHDFAATVYRLLGIDSTQEYLTPDGRPVLINYHGKPIHEVMS